jgi:topoisomerase IA-like protein
MIGKNGPVIKCGDGKEVSFKSVKKDIDLNKLRKGGYTLEEITEDTSENTKLNKKLGVYKKSELFLKKGKFGLYASWGENKKSLNNIDIDQDDITLEDVIRVIESETNNNLVRYISNELSIRKGKYGDYIFYKTSKMNKPQFHKLNGFKEDYKKCDEKILVSWIDETYKISV